MANALRTADNVAGALIGELEQTGIVSRSVTMDIDLGNHALFGTAPYRLLLFAQQNAQRLQAEARQHAGMVEQQRKPGIIVAPAVAVRFS